MTKRSKPKIKEKHYVETSSTISIELANSVVRSMPDEDGMDSIDFIELYQSIVFEREVERQAIEFRSYTMLQEAGIPMTRLVRLIRKNIISDSFEAEEARDIDLLLALRSLENQHRGLITNQAIEDLLSDVRIHTIRTLLQNREAFNEHLNRELSNFVSARELSIGARELSNSSVSFSSSSSSSRFIRETLSIEVPSNHSLIDDNEESVFFDEDLTPPLSFFRNMAIAAQADNLILGEEGGDYSAAAYIGASK